ncbi:IS200/IS605 family transposase [Nonlabens antarcticus]|uniref:IS200/IS605 family transposase n=1 Tax=Nonlabens antarcticus TaxID=392714 RepID=UPI001891B30F|nr:IS200/IS605 family transposase [Nonlabens antarcticus]
MSRNDIQVYYHLIFGTKYRENTISSLLHYGIYGCIWNKCEEIKVKPIIVDGTENHIHVLVKPNSKITISSMVHLIKGSSSKWLNENHEFLEPFRWQRGYGIFSVSPKDVDMITAYIKKQKEHHNNGTVESQWEV